MEEPYEEVPHVRICAGGRRQRRSLPRFQFLSEYDLVGNRDLMKAEFRTGAEPNPKVTADYTTAYLFDSLDRNTRITQTAQGSGAGFHAVQDNRVNLAYNLPGQYTFIQPLRERECHRDRTAIESPETDLTW